MLSTAQVPVRIQPTHLLCRRWPTPAGAPPSANKTPSSESGDDAPDTEEEQTPAAAKKSNIVTGRCSKAGMQQHKAALAAAAAAEEEEEEARRDAILNPAHLDAVATAAQATDGQFGYEHLEEPLSLFDFHRWVTPASFVCRRALLSCLYRRQRRQQSAAAVGMVSGNSSSSRWLFGVFGAQFACCTRAASVVVATITAAARCNRQRNRRGLGQC
jgi:hypothetical protein